MSEQVPAVAEVTQTPPATTPPAAAPVTPPPVVPAIDPAVAAPVVAPAAVVPASTVLTEGNAGIPEKYDFKLPDGSLLDPKTVDGLSAFSKENGLSQKQAQGVLDRENAAVAAYAGKQQETLKQTMEAWVPEIRNDAEIGGNNFNKSIESAKLVVQKFATPAFTKILNDTGFGNHPEIVRIFARIAKDYMPAEIIKAQNATPTRKETKDVFYDNKE